MRNAIKYLHIVYYCRMHYSLEKSLFVAMLFCKFHNLCIIISINIVVSIIQQTSAFKSSASKLPALKDIVNLLCAFIGKEMKVAKTKDRKQSNEVYFICKCLKKENCTNNKEGSKIFIPKKRGFTNCLSHLKTYLSHGDINHLHTTCSDNLRLQQSYIGDLFEPILSKSKQKTN